MNAVEYNVLPKVEMLEQVVSVDQINIPKNAFYRDWTINDIKALFKDYLTTDDYAQWASKYKVQCSITSTGKMRPTVNIKFNQQCSCCGGTDFTRTMTGRSQYRTYLNYNREVHCSSNYINCANPYCRAVIDVHSGTHKYGCICRACCAETYSDIYHYSIPVNNQNKEFLHIPLKTRNNLKANIALSADNDLKAKQELSIIIFDLLISVFSNAGLLRYSTYYDVNVTYKNPDKEGSNYFRELDEIIPHNFKNTVGLSCSIGFGLMCVKGRLLEILPDDAGFINEVGQFVLESILSTLKDQGNKFSSRGLIKVLKNVKCGFNWDEQLAKEIITPFIGKPRVLKTPKVDEQPKRKSKPSRSTSSNKLKAVAFDKILLEAKNNELSDTSFRVFVCDLVKYTSENI